MSGENSANRKNTKRRGPIRYWRELGGRLYARLQYKDEAGKKRDKLKPITDKRTARSVVEALRRELEERGPKALQVDSLTFSELASIYKETKLIPAVSSNRVKVAGRKSRVDWAYQPLVEHFGGRKLKMIRPTNLEAYKLKRLDGITKRGTKRNIATVSRELSLLRAMLNFAVQNDYLVQSPFSKIRGVIMTSAENERDRVLSFDEEARLLDVCTGRRAHLRAVLICALDTAIRAGEIFTMRWKDITLWQEIRIPQTNSKTEETRIVGITPRLKSELLAMWDVSRKDQEDLVFGIESSVRRSLKSACTEVDVNDFRFHDCRHTATTRMIASGSPHTEVMKITGHSQLKTFLRYLNITTEAANRVADKLHQYLDSKRHEIQQVSEQIN